jgi:hypothetical protein
MSAFYERMLIGSNRLRPCATKLGKGESSKM